MAPLTKTFKLNTGAEIPAVGLGTWQSPPGQVEKAVEVALRAGYRHIDTAYAYGNEKEVGKGIKASGVPREKIWLTTKLDNDWHKHVAEAIDTSLKNLDTPYVDLYLMHWPANGANLFAKAVQPHGGIVMFRAFVYDNHINPADPKADRANHAVEFFKGLDGQFLDNVVVQIKYGPIDFQVREPASPLFANIPQTNTAIELQITQEYLGQQSHLVYVAPLWKTILDFDLRADEPIIGDMTLLDLLGSRSLTFLINKGEQSVQFGKKEMAPPVRYPFNYPFPERQSFNIDLFKDMIEKYKGKRFRPTYVFDNDEQSVCNTSLAQVMDIYWLYKASRDIHEIKVPAYFVCMQDNEPADSDTTMYLAVIRLTSDFRSQYKSHWDRLTKDRLVSLDLYGSQGVDCRGRGRIMQRPEMLSDLANKHAIAGQFEFDLVVQVPVSGGYRNDLKTFEGRVEAEEAFKNNVALKFTVLLSDLERKVAATETFLPDSEPYPGPKVLEDSQPCPDPKVLEDSRDELHFRMALHRDLMRGTGFYNTLTGFGEPLSEAMHAMTLGTEEARPRQHLRSVPTFDFFEIEDTVLRDAVLDETLPQDRSRMERYGSSRAFNVALVSAPGGTGKTTALSTLTLGGLKCLGGGKVFGSGPTNMAVTNFALRVYARGRAVAERCNKHKPTSDTATPQYRYPLVVRGYSAKVEVDAFKNILKTGVADDTAYKSPNPSDTPRWRLPLSASNWLLAILRFKPLEQSKEADAVKTLVPEHAPSLYEIKAGIDELDGTVGAVARLAQLARGELTWDAYRNGDMVANNLLEDWLKRIIKAADVVMTTPAIAQTKWFSEIWAGAKVIAVDEAGCLHKADLCSIWGNTLRPIVLAGDAKQLPPTMMELENKDDAGNYANPFATCGRISALAWLQAAGIPTFRLLHQLRMCQGMFDLANQLFYPDYPKMPYGDSCKASNDGHAVGVALEKYLAGRNLKQPLAPSPKDSLLPVFWHMPNTKVYQVGTSKLNRMQVKGALELLSDFVEKSPNVSPRDFVVISAHKPNVEYGNKLLKHFPLLKDMPSLQTADSFQGREGSISVVITGTSNGINAGFISDENRLNVMLTRQKSGLLIVGDKDVTGPLKGTGKAVSNADRQAAKGKVGHNNHGEQVFSKVKALRNMLKELHKIERIIEICADKEKEDKAYEDKLADEEKKLAEEENAKEMELRAADDLTEYEEWMVWGNMYDEEDVAD